jgi:hydroxymethylbilane synthase
MRLRLGARGSSLSLAQATLIERALAPHAQVERVLVQTTGDRRSARGEPVGWKGDFTKELDEALLAGRVDLAVHSLKDVPSALPEGLVLAAVPRREDPRDALVTRSGHRFSELPAASRVGTSSPRRRAQLLRARPDLEVLDARGNVDTRLRRLSEGKWDALVLARAGLARLGRLDEITELFSEEVLLPAPGQGALALVARRGDAPVLEAVAPLEDPDARGEVLAERSLLARLEAGCQAPVAARARVEAGVVALAAGVFSADGSRALLEEGRGPADAAEALGESLAERLLSRGAAELIGERRA